MLKKANRVRNLTISDRAAEVLVDEILSHPDGTYLGSEADVAARLGISAPTLRQAAKLLEYQQLLTIKTGRAGGYFSRKPTIEGVAHLAGIVLRANRATFGHTARMVRLVTAEAIRRACACEDAGQRRQLKDMLAVDTAIITSENPAAFMEWYGNLSLHIGDMSNDPVLVLVNEIILEIFSRHDQLPFYRSVTHRRKLYQLAKQIGEAILAGEVDAAVNVHAQRLDYIESRVDANTPAGH